jgi:hypothetical protein
LSGEHALEAFVSLQIILLTRNSVRASLYIRLPVDKHRRFCAYAKRAGFSVNTATEMLIDQILAQVDADFRWPDWLIEAVDAGALPLHMPRPIDDDPGDDCSAEEPFERKALHAV